MTATALVLGGSVFVGKHLVAQLVERDMEVAVLNRGRTVIRIAQFSWTGPRLEIAKRLWSLHNQGCVTQVLYNEHLAELFALVQVGTQVRII